MIESVNNERVKEIAKLHDKKYRKINNKFLAVGKHLVEEALKKNLVLELYLLVGTPNTYSFDATYVSEKVMKKLSEQTSSPKELAVCKIENNNEIITLNNPNQGLYISGLIWRKMINFSPDCVLLVLADDFYNESDYIRNYDEFLKVVKSNEQ